MRRGRHPSGCATESRLSGALGRVAEIDSENTFVVVSFARIREYRRDVTVGDSEEDEAGYDRDGKRNGASNRIWRCKRPGRRHPGRQFTPQPTPLGSNRAEPSGAGPDDA